MNQPPPHTEIAIAGAGLVGLTLALALRSSGAEVTVLTAAHPFSGASFAAAGMLAVHDPHNPPQLLPLAQLSRSLFPALLHRLHELSGIAVTPQTTRTLQQVAVPPLPRSELAATLHLVDENYAELDEWSLDPRELAACLQQSVASAGIPLFQQSPILSVHEHGREVVLRTPDSTLTANHFIDCTGAWSLATGLVPEIAVLPRKGQMLTVTTPPSLRQTPCVVRTEHLYLVPRVHGPRAGQTLIGASVEDAGFDLSLSNSTLEALHRQAAELMPALHGSSEVQRWAGLRPATADSLPLLGRLPRHSRCYIASGHFRNGILLAPGTAQVMTELLQDRAPSVDLAAFRPDRFVTG